MRVDIRKASNVDITVLEKLGASLSLYNAEESGLKDLWFKKNWRKVRKKAAYNALHNKHGVVYLAEVDHKPVGYAYGYVYPEQEMVVLEELFIAKEHRSNGIGKKLFDQIESWAKKHHFPMKVEVYPWNKKTITFYEKQGYRMTSYCYTKE